ncbi:MAG: glycoside hydrolase family 127 protein, partial [Bacteroidales bacterium]|nr:glycoside hydrolase family 127 protein [Bacteroidales bacterium]
MKYYRLLQILPVALIGLTGCTNQKSTSGDYPIQPVAFNQVKLDDAFWSPRVKRNAGLTIPYAFKQSEETGRIKNFDIAAGVEKGSFCSTYPFDDSDVYKIIEGASYSLQTVPDAKLEAYLDQLIARIGAAQEPDGYLYTNRTIMGDSAHPWAGKKRWELESENSHELYNLGHFFEAAVAHYQATGKKTMLDIATKAADLIVKDFGWGKCEHYPGHQEVEIGLTKLYRVTGKKEYLDLAKFFLDVRGPKGEVYNQAHKKVVDQTDAEGHAVRANYMFSGMADVAALTGDQSYLKAIDTIWKNVVGKKLYITGGVGATGAGEAYGIDYQLPNMTAYCETCANIANVFWNYRMFLLHGDAKYIDVLERSLYNSVISGLGLSGDRFFYPNVLRSQGQHARSPWFGCACCPSNLCRFIPSVPGYIYAVKDNNLYVNLFVQSKADIKMGSSKVSIKQVTDYPWKGEIKLAINPEKKSRFNLMVRIPGWTGSQVVPSDLYSFVDPENNKVTITVNGDPVSYKSENGFAILGRSWKSGDIVKISMPMDIRRVRANDKVKADKGMVALQRGPLVYTLEWADQAGQKALDLILAEEPGFVYDFHPQLLDGVGMITGKGYSLKSNLDGTVDKTPVDINAIPYYAWANRGRGEMTVWIPESEASATPQAAPTIACRATVTASKCKGAPETVKDQQCPEKSSDAEYVHIHWWPATATNERVQYDFAKPEKVSSVEVLWFDDEDL